METNSRVFISYAYNTKEFSNRVLTFANMLKDKYIDVMLDQYIEDPVEGWPTWIETNIRNSNYVLVICTKEYASKVYESKEENGKGVKWEKNIVYQCIYDNYSNNNKFIPIILDGSSSEDVPIPLKGATFYFPDQPESFEKLCNRLCGKSDNDFIENIISEVKNAKINDCSEIISDENEIKEYYIEKVATYSLQSQHLDFDGFLPQMSNKLILGSCSIEFKRNELKDFVLTLNHTQIMLLFEKLEMREEEWFFSQKYNENNKYRFFIGNVLLILTKEEISDILNLLRKYYSYYMVELRKIVAHFEIDKFKRSKMNGLCYRLFEIKISLWELLKEFANKHSYSNCENQWNIFNPNSNAINVFSSIGSQNFRYNAGMHAYFMVENTDVIDDDSVWIIMNMDITGSHNVKIEDYNERNVWGALTAYKWLVNEFLPRVAKEYKISNIENFYDDFGIKYKLNLKKESIISDLQMFYMSNDIYISDMEMRNIIQSLIFCLSKKELPINEYEYILQKLGLTSEINLNDSTPYNISNGIISILKYRVYNKYQADYLLRCILTFVDGMSKNRLSSEELEIVISNLSSLINKMNNIEFIRKYLTFGDVN